MSHQTRNPFREIFDFESGELSIEKRLAGDPRVKRLDRRILDYHAQMKAALGSDLRVWLGLEALINEREDVFEEAFFNSGFEHGFAAGEASALRALASGGDTRYRVLADRLRGLVLEGEISRDEAVAALVENAWVLAVRSAG